MKTRLSKYALFAILLCVGLRVLIAAGADRRTRQDAARMDSVPGRTLGADYLLQPQDVLRVHIFQHEDLNKQSEAVSISQDYTIYLPLIQTISVKGKTVRQAEDMIRAAYDKDFLVNPQVSINVVKYAERAVNVVGQVQKPGRIQFPQERGLTIVEALSDAGGPTRLADLKKVKLTRKNADGETVTEEINVDAMWNRGGRDATPLQKDDVVYVPERII
jgi:polysaccharide biosynthesis/export protein